MYVAVLGASGKGGSEITKELVRREHKVLAIGRHAETLPSGEGITPKVGDASDAQALATLIQGVDAVISAVHFDIPASTFLTAVKAAGVNRLLIMGGAASLKNADGVMLYDSPGFPDFIKPRVLPAIHFLAADQLDLAKHFGEETGDEVDKFADCNWHNGPMGVPILNDVARWISGPIVAVLPDITGDHQGFVIEPNYGATGKWKGQLGFQSAQDLQAAHGS